MKKFKDTKALVMLLALGLFAGLGGKIFESAQFSGNSNPNTAATILANGEAKKEEPVETAMLLGFVGNLALTEEAEDAVQKNNNNYPALFEGASFLKTPDFVFANATGPITKLSKGSLVMDPALLSPLKSANIDVLSLTDTHVFDAGREGFENTLKNIQEADILPCGAGMNHDEAATPTIVSKNGLSVGYLCFSDVVEENMIATTNTSGVLSADDKNFDDIIKSAASKVNTLVVAFNFGSTKDTEYSSRQEKLAREAVDNGANMVIGTHPYVPEENVTYNDVPIIYSLGNFISPLSNSPKLTNGIFATALVNEKGLSDVSLYPLSMDKHFGISLK